MKGQSEEAVLVLAAALLLPFVLFGLYRRREAVAWFLRRLIIGELVLFGVMWVGIQNHWPVLQSMFAGLLALVVVVRLMPTRSRHVRKRERRKVIAKFESKTGQKYDSRLHHIHHKVPFSDGGSSTSDNLEIIDATENLSRGASVPWWDLIGKRRRR